MNRVMDEMSNGMSLGISNETDDGMDERHE
jgi:hypothetical protein